jgi:hypothetical protein
MPAPSSDILAAPSRDAAEARLTFLSTAGGRMRRAASRDGQVAEGLISWLAAVGASALAQRACQLRFPAGTKPVRQCPGELPPAQGASAKKHTSGV